MRDAKYYAGTMLSRSLCQNTIRSGGWHVANGMLRPLELWLRISFRDVGKEKNFGLGTQRCDLSSSALK